VAEINDKPAGAVAAWIEGKDGLSSGIRKLSALSFVLSRRTIELSKSNLATVSEVSIQREKGTLQIESVFTDSPYRGQGIAGNLINKHITEFRKSNPLLEKAQIQLMNENVAAIKAYQKIGFEIAENKTSNNPDITNLLPGKTKLMLQKIIIDR